MDHRWKIAFICGLIFFVLLCLADGARAQSESEAPKPYQAVVHWIKDGDSMIVKTGKTGNIKRELRLAGIDCPEYKQPYGRKALQFVIELAKKKTVTVIPVEKDKYGRWVSWVRLPDGKLLNHEILKAGLAWWFKRYYPDDKKLARLEQDARKAKRGLWEQEKPVPPWDWRRKHRQ